MQILVENQFEFVTELRSKPDLASMPLFSTGVTPDIGDLVEETVVAAILADELPADCELVTARVRPVFQREPFVDYIEIELAIDYEGRASTVARQFRSGNWSRLAQQCVARLTEEGALEENDEVYRMLLALRSETPIAVPVAPVQPPLIPTTTLEACGVRQLTEGALDAHRPILVNEQLAAEAVQRCEQAGVLETGAAVGGQIVRLPEPLPGAATPIVTILSSMFYDLRHEGTETRFHFSPAALAEAQRLCDLRGLGEQIICVFHTHGWSAECGNCNQNANCPLAEAVPSLQDYQLLKTLFPGKTTVLPIAGRKLGHERRRPILQIHAWRAGQMRAIDWRAYRD